jgi:membrane protease YdiL (CAAX protease family)
MCITAWLVPLPMRCVRLLEIANEVGCCRFEACSGFLRRRLQVRRLLDTKCSYVACGAISSIVVGIGVNAISWYGLDRELAAILVIAPVTLTLLLIFPEPMDFGWKTISYAAYGVIVGMIFFYIKYGKVGASLYSENGASDYACYVLDVSVVSPAFEEIVVRKLLFLGLTRKVGPPISAIFVSLLFGLVHVDMSVYAGSFSIVMCIMTWRGVSTFNRAVLHGGHNFAMAAIMILSGLNHSV